MEAKELKTHTICVGLPTSKNPDRVREMFVYGGTVNVQQTTRWTTYVRRCVVCRRLFRISQDAWDYARDGYLVVHGQHPAILASRSVEQIVLDNFQHCMYCSGDKETPEEYGIPDYILKTPELIDKMSVHMIKEIIADIRANQLPFLVQSYSELHEYTDANLYGLDVIEPYMNEPQACEYVIEKIANAAQGVTDAWLKARFQALNQTMIHG